MFYGVGGRVHKFFLNIFAELLLSAFGLGLVCEPNGTQKGNDATEKSVRGRKGNAIKCF